MESFERFMEQTESSNQSLELQPRTDELMYPLVYVEGVTNVELRDWVNQYILHPSKESDIDFPLYWKRPDSWKFLGYVTLGFNTLKGICALTYRRPMFMTEPDKEEEIKDRIAYMFMLSD